MAIGDVYRFETDQAAGYDSKTKLHISLGHTTHFRALAPFPFLFISTSDYGSCFPIAQADYNGILDHDSHISCSNLVYYTLDYLKDRKVKPIGSISKEHLAALRDHLADHEVMVPWEIGIACDALKGFV